MLMKYHHEKSEDPMRPKTWHMRDTNVVIPMRSIAVI